MWHPREKAQSQESDTDGAYYQKDTEDNKKRTGWVYKPQFEVEVPIKVISVGPDRKQTIIK